MTANYPEVEGYIQQLRQLRAEMLKWCEGLPPEGLNWTPPVKDTNSIYVLATHVAGSEAWWLHQIVGGIDVKRDRPAEFAAVGDDLALLKWRFDSVAQQSETILRGLSEAGLRSERSTTYGQRSVQWCILHVAEHLSRHIGHAELTRQWWEAIKT